MVNGMQRKEQLRTFSKLRGSAAAPLNTTAYQSLVLRVCVCVMKAALYVRYLLQPVTRAGDAGLETHGGRDPQA